jgi:hypothetical protein
MTWDLPPYKSAEFNSLVTDLDHFRTLPVYRFAVKRRVIVNDEWVGRVPGVTKLMHDAPIMKGGEGSGNFGHAGRPGEVGGSAPGEAGGVPSRPGRLDPNKPVPRRFTEQWFRQRLRHRIELAQRGEGQRLLIREGETRPAAFDLRRMTAEQCKAEWERFRDAATGFREEGDVTEWNRHYNYGRYYFRQWQNLTGGTPAPSVAAAPGSAAAPALGSTPQNVINDNLTASCSDLIRQGKMVQGALGSRTAEAMTEAFERETGLNIGMYFDNVFKDSGLTYKITNLSVQDKYVSYSIGAYKDGVNIGSQSRNFDFNSDSVDHSYWQFTTGNTGRGFSRTIMRNSFLLYQRMGFKQAEVGAGLTVGGYAWLKYGFVPNRTAWSGGYGSPGLRGVAKQWGRDNIRDAETRRAWDLICNSDDPKSAWELSDFNSHPDTDQLFDDRSTWGEGHQFLANQGWHGLLKFNDPQCMSRLFAYAAAKPKLRR